MEKQNIDFGFDLQWWNVDHNGPTKPHRYHWDLDNGVAVLMGGGGKLTFFKLRKSGFSTGGHMRFDNVLQPTGLWNGAYISIYYKCLLNGFEG